MVGRRARDAVALSSQSVFTAHAGEARGPWLETSERDRREAYIPTKQPPSQPQARVSGSHEHPRRPGGVEIPPRQRPRSPLRLIARIRDRDSFVRLRRDGVRLRSEPLWCTYLADADMTPPRIGFAIARTVGSAATRNRLRRRLKAILAAADVPPGLLLIGASPRVNELTFAQLGERTDTLIAAARRTAADLSGPA